MALVVFSSYIARADIIPANISPHAISEFKKVFKEATDIQWARFGEVFRVKFKYNTQLLYAFYNEEGHRICMGRTLNLSDLPFLLQAEFQKTFTNYPIIDAFEISCDSSVNYYVAIINENKKIILRSENNSWIIYSKTKIK